MEVEHSEATSPETIVNTFEGKKEIELVQLLLEQKWTKFVLLESQC